LVRRFPINHPKTENIRSQFALCGTIACILRASFLIGFLPFFNSNDVHQLIGLFIFSIYGSSKGSSLFRYRLSCIYKRLELFIPPLNCFFQILSAIFDTCLKTFLCKQVPKNLYYKVLLNKNYYIINKYNFNILTSIFGMKKKSK